MPPSTRKRGGQPGNRNSIKHGFYARTFTPADQKDLAGRQVINFQDEIALLRVCIRRLAGLTATITDPLDLAGIVRVIAMTASSLARLIAAQKTFVPTNELSEVIRLAVQDKFGDLPLFQEKGLDGFAGFEEDDPLYRYQHPPAPPDP